MNFEGLRNRMHHEEKIKHRLHLIDFEEAQQQHHHNSRHLYDLHAKINRKNSDERDISDWMNSRSTHLNKTSKKQPELVLPNYKKIFAFDSTRYHSSLLQKNGSKGQRLELSPIAVKFNAKLLSLNLKNSKDAFLQKLHEDPYVTHYRSISCRKSNQRESPKIKQLQLPWKESAAMNKNQKTFGLLYLLKRHEPTRIAQKRNNPKDLTVVKIA